MGGKPRLRAARDFPRGEAFALLLVAQRLQRDGAVVFQRADGGGNLPARQATAQTIKLFRELGVDGVFLLMSSYSLS